MKCDNCNDELAALRCNYCGHETSVEEIVKHAYNAGVAWAIGNGMSIEDYLEAQKNG